MILFNHNLTWKNHLKLLNWLNEARILNLIGLTGVHPGESKKARAWSRIFNYAVVAVAIVLLLQWQLEILHTISGFQSRVVNTAVWLFFVLEFAVLMSFVKDRWRYLSQNWLLIVIVVFGAALLSDNIYLYRFTQVLRPILAVVILSPAISLLMAFFYDGKLRTTLMAAAVIVVIFGLLVDGVDPNIKSAWDGIWWAIVTVSTVGYGDVVPTSALGRLIAVGLIILGLGIFVVITANFLAIVLRKEVKGVKKEEIQVEKILKEVGRIREELAEIKKAVKKGNNKEH